MTTSKQPQQRWMTTQPVPDFIPHGVTPPCRAICHRCPLESKCGQWAIASGEQWGLWGGLDPAQRNALRRKMELAS